MGKSAVVYVIGLTVLIAIALYNVNQSSVESMDTYSAYFGRTMSHNIALAGANIATNKILFNATYATAFSDSFAGGTFSVHFDSTAPKTKTVTVIAAYAAGTTLTGDAIIRDTIRALFQYVMFSRYGWFTDRESNGYLDTNGLPGPYYNASDWKITGDSVFGYAHTNGHFNLGGTPFFQKKVTATNGPSTMTVGGVYNPTFNEGYEWGRTLTRDTANIIALRNNLNTGSPLPASLFQNRDVGFDFKSDGTIRVLVPWNPGGVAWGTTGATLDTIVSISALSSSSVIGVEGGDAHVKGTYKGQVTVMALSGASGPSTNKGNIWVDGNIKAATNPQTNPNSTDMLGLVAERMGYISKDMSRTPASVLEIQAAIYCHRGEFTAEDFWNLPLQGRVALYGSLCQSTAGALGVFSGGGLTHGMFYSVYHDSRFLTQGPPSFPFSTKYRLVSWWEN
jgi:hypothetical protein